MLVVLCTGVRIPPRPPFKIVTSDEKEAGFILALKVPENGEVLSEDTLDDWLTQGLKGVFEFIDPDNVHWQQINFVLWLEFITKKHSSVRGGAAIDTVARFADEFAEMYFPDE